MLNVLYLLTPMLIIIAAAFIIWLFEKNTYEQEIKDESSTGDEDSEGIQVSN
jgi:hypothetical protein